MRKHERCIGSMDERQRLGQILYGKGGRSIHKDMIDVPRRSKYSPGIMIWNSRITWAIWDGKDSSKIEAVRRLDVLYYYYSTL